MESGDNAVNLIASTHALRVDGGTIHNKPDQSLYTQLKKFWELESFEIVKNESLVYDQFICHGKIHVQSYRTTLS